MGQSSMPQTQLCSASDLYADCCRHAWLHTLFEIHAAMCYIQSIQDEIIMHAMWRILTGTGSERLGPFVWTTSAAFA